eukprot:10496678-Ditylum_brightwellii.AAC.1
MIAVNQGNLIPRLMRSKTADQVLQAPNNLTLPTNKPWEGELVCHSQETSDKLTEVPNMPGKQNPEDMSGRNRQ